MFINFCFFNLYIYLLLFFVIPFNVQTVQVKHELAKSKGASVLAAILLGLPFFDFYSVGDLILCAVTALLFILKKPWRVY